MATKAHKLLKEQAKRLLEKQGFSKSEIFEEYKCKECNGGYLLVDVVGIKTGLKVGVECGQLATSNPCDRFIALKTCVDKIIWLPYLPLYGIGISQYKKLKDIEEWEKAIKLHEYILKTQGTDPDIERSLRIVLQDVKLRRSGGEELDSYPGPIKNR